MQAHEAAPGPAAAAEGEAVFRRVLVGIDETPESLVAAAQAAVLRTPGGRLVLVAVAERYLAAHAGMAAVDAEDRLTAAASEDLERARALARSSTPTRPRSHRADSCPCSAPSARAVTPRSSRSGCVRTGVWALSRSAATTSTRSTTHRARC